MAISVYFISDLHFGHSNLAYFRRGIHNIPFESSDEVDEWLVDSWNNTVKKESDIVWVLGDVAWSKTSLKNMDRLTGDKRLILGNHDTENLSIKELLGYFSSIHGMYSKYGFIMSHCPIHPNELEYRNWDMNIHGHIHHIEKQKEMEKENPDKYFNVNVDIIGPNPIKLEYLREKLDSRRK